MADYYEILGISRNADSTQIRTAYKRLAMQYHPDRNPGNPTAEEHFKELNEAYHTLSDPLKKSRYDARLNAFDSATVTDEEYWREIQRRKYARWQQAQQNRSTYTIDKNYFKIQGLAFLVFIILSGICFGIINTGKYFLDLKRQEAWEQKHKLVAEAQSLFSAGKFDEAIQQIISLQEKDPLEFQFMTAHDSLIQTLRMNGDQEYISGDFDQALKFFMPLKKYEFPPRSETLKKISICQLNLGHYEDALQSSKQLFAQQPWNVELAYQIGVINLRYLNNTEEALYYLTIGKDLFRENLTEIYGEAFQVVMDPADLPDVYFDIFVARGSTNLALKKFKDALKDLNWAIYLRPQQAEPYKLRALAKVGLKEKFMLCTDLTKAQKLGANGINELKQKYCR